MCKGLPGVVKETAPTGRVGAVSGNWEIPKRRIGKPLGFFSIYGLCIDSARYAVGL